MPTNVSLILKSLAFAALLAQTAAAQKAAVPPVTPPRGPFTCTELTGLYSSGEWWDGGFYDGLGDLKPRWQGRFSHYGYTYEYAKPNSYTWSPGRHGVTCAACLRPWRLLRAHVVATKDRGCQAQCPACGVQQSVSEDELAKCFES